MFRNKKTKNLTPEKTILSMTATTSSRVKKALKQSLSMKLIAALYWAFTIMSVLSIMIAVTAPFDQIGLQANVLHTYHADTIPKLQNDFIVSPKGKSSESKYASHGMPEVVIGEFRIRAGDNDIEIEGLKPCVKQIGKGHLFGNLRVMVDEKKSKNSSFSVSAGAAKKIQIIANISDQAKAGDRLQAGICKPFKVTKNGESISTENTFPIYDRPTSIIGSRSIFIDKRKR